jgi:hypothetical protein
MYACVRKPGCGFLEGVCVTRLRPHISYDPPHRLAIRELASRMLIAAMENGADNTVICPVRSITYMRLGHKLINVVVVAVFKAVDIA